MLTQTRYFDNVAESLYGQTGKRLGITQTSTSAVSVRTGVYATWSWGIRVWVLHSDESMTEVTSGTPIAVVTRTAQGEGEQCATWGCPGTSLAPLDAVLVIVYTRRASDEWQTTYINWISNILVGEKLEAATWTVYYWTKVYMIGGGTVFGADFYFGDAAHDSRIENFSYTLLASPPALEYSDLEAVTIESAVIENIKPVPGRSWPYIVGTPVTVADRVTLTGKVESLAEIEEIANYYSVESQLVIPESGLRGYVESFRHWRNVEDPDEWFFEVIISERGAYFNATYFNSTYFNAS